MTMLLLLFAGGGGVAASKSGDDTGVILRGRRRDLRREERERDLAEALRDKGLRESYDKLFNPAKPAVAVPDVAPAPVLARIKRVIAAPVAGAMGVVRALSAARAAPVSDAAMPATVFEDDDEEVLLCLSMM